MTYSLLEKAQQLTIGIVATLWIAEGQYVGRILAGMKP
jgi:hypothetical protein